MAAIDDLGQVLEQWQQASGEFLKGNPEPVQKLWSHREDVSLANPFGPPCVGGMRLPRLRSMPPRYAAMESSSALRS